MEIELISIGDRLLLSDILDTNAAHLSRQLHDAGLPVVCKTTVGDSIAILLDVLQSAAGRSQVIITIGGQADQTDGLVQRAIAHLEGPIDVDEEPLTLAMGTCLLLVWPRLVIATLPDDRREMAYLLTTELLPYLQKHFASQWHRESLTLRVVGIAESSIADRLSDLMPYELACISYNSYAGQTAVSLWADSYLKEQATVNLAHLRQMVKSRLNSYVFGEGDVRLEDRTVVMLNQCSCHLAIAEYGTDGTLVKLLKTAVSAPRIDNIVTDDWQELNTKLGYTANEEDVDWTRSGRSIAEKLRVQFQTELGLFIHKRITGGGVQIMVTLATPKGVSIAQRFFGGEPQSINDWASTLGLDHLYRWLLANITAE